MRITEKIRSASSRNLIYYGLLLLLTAGIVIFLLNSKLPWENGVSARQLEGKTVKPEHYAVTGLWYGALAALLTLVVLAVSGKFALRKLGGGFERLQAGIGRRSSPAFLVLAALAITLSAVQMVPRLDHSLWGDEDYTARRAIVGQWERDAEDTLAFREVKWTDTLFYYKNPNNHVLYSILARLAHSSYSNSGEATNLHFKESLLRVPAFLFGLGSVIALGYLLAVIGYRRAAIGAMFLLVFHPWYLRHACEARGYSIALCLAPLTLTFLIKALRRGRLCYWCVFGIMQFLLFYAYPGTIYILVAMNMAALLYIWRNSRELDRADQVILSTRWFSSCTFSALPVLIMMAPNLPQMRAYLERSRAQGELTANWIVDNLSYLATGMPWKAWEIGNPNCLYLSETPALSLVILIAFYGLLILGALRLCRPGYRWLLITLCLPYLLMLSHSILGKVLLYHWYSVIQLPFAICLVALGLERLSRRIQSIRLRTQAGLLLVVVALLPYSAFTGAQRKLQRDQSVEPLRESVSMTRQVLNPVHSGIDDAITVQFCMITPGYDPTSYIIKRKYTPDVAQKLHSLLKKADQSSSPLHVNIGQIALARLQWPELMEILENQELFKALPPLYGLQPGCNRYIFKYIGNATSTQTH
ncbi:MAG: hypothetical protein VYB61_00625 [Verrucomicrobiota bacterium]|nr:hypothetical protein [Verrucomicrobiota bacterium]